MPSRCRPIFCSKNRPKARSQVIECPKIGSQTDVCWLSYQNFPAEASVPEQSDHTLLIKAEPLLFRP